MPAPSQLAIHASALQRLVKEESSYQVELKQQEARIAKLEQGSTDENAEYILRQERKAAEETKAVFPQLRQQIQEALAKLEAQLEQGKATEGKNSPEDIAKAEDAIAAAKNAIQKS